MLEFFLALRIPLIIVQVGLSVLLVLCILLQAGKGDDIGSAFSGGTGNQISGTGGTSKLIVRLTVIFATLFMVNSIALAKIFKELPGASATRKMAEPIAPNSPLAGTAANAINAGAATTTGNAIQGNTPATAASAKASADVKASAPTKASVPAAASPAAH